MEGIMFTGRKATCSVIKAWENKIMVQYRAWGLMGTELSGGGGMGWIENVVMKTDHKGVCMPS